MTAPEIERLCDAIRAGAEGEVVIEQLDAWQLEPVERPLDRLGHYAHDSARRLGKGEIEVEIRGGNVRVDPARFAGLWPALVHLIRNAIDHGIESPGQRESAGKPAIARVSLIASAQHGDLVMMVADDGGGINWDRVRSVAIERKLPHRDPRELLQALLSPGFTTRSEVTLTSGRGIGMAALQEQVAILGGAISVESTPGRGTSWRITIPLAPGAGLASDFLAPWPGAPSRELRAGVRKAVNKRVS